MNWYYQILGGHTHVRVYMNGGKCGELVFTNVEFAQVRQALEYAVPKMRGKTQEAIPVVTFFLQEL